MDLPKLTTPNGLYSYVLGLLSAGVLVIGVLRVAAFFGIVTVPF